MSESLGISPAGRKNSKAADERKLLRCGPARREVEFPDEARYEYEFNGAVALLRTLVAPTNATTIKTKSNFYTVFGACVEYLRRTTRTSFQNQAAILAALSDLFESARSGATGGKPDYFAEYTDAVSRAASDRGRRARRQEIVLELITQADLPTPA